VNQEERNRYKSTMLITSQRNQSLEGSGFKQEKRITRGLPEISFGVLTKPN